MLILQSSNVYTENKLHIMGWNWETESYSDNSYILVNNSTYFYGGEEGRQVPLHYRVGYYAGNYEFLYRLNWNVLLFNAWWK